MPSPRILFELTRCFAFEKYLARLSADLTLSPSATIPCKISCALSQRCPSELEKKPLSPANLIFSAIPVFETIYLYKSEDALGFSEAIFLAVCLNTLI